MRANINLVHCDCLEAMKGMADNQFDLAIVDPPYGIGEDGKSNHSRDRKARATRFKHKDWDSKKPEKIYFEEIVRVSKNQVIWGANHFGHMQPSSCWIVWDKDNGNSDFADCELAWTGFGSTTRKIKYRWNGMLQENMKNKEKRIHPTQKPVALYKWLLTNYAKPGNKILDTHLGSGSIAIACWDLKFDLEAYEIDADYYNAAKKRFDTHIKQGLLF